MEKFVCVILNEIIRNGQQRKIKALRPPLFPSVQTGDIGNSFFNMISFNNRRFKRSVFDLLPLEACQAPD